MPQSDVLSASEIVEAFSNCVEFVKFELDSLVLLDDLIAGDMERKHEISSL